MKLRRRATLRLASNLCPHGFGHRRNVRQALGQGPEIKPRPADENNRLFADVRQSLARGKHPAAGRKIDGSVDRAEQAMRREPLLVRRRPGGQESEIPIDLHRIGVDDRRPEALCERKRRRRLAARRWACDEKRPSQVLARSSGSVMSSVLVATLIADPSTAPLSEATVDRAAQALNGIERRRWLDEGVAADLVFTGDLKAKRAALEGALKGEPIDVIVQPLAHRRKRLLVADMDSTLIGQECVDELAALAGVGDRVAAITERAMRGEVAFAPALRERVALLAGLPETVIGEVLKERITLNRGARTLVQTMRANGAYVAIVSGGFRQFTGAIRERLGADEDRANVLVIEGGKLTGKVIEPILGQDAKLGALKAIAAAIGLTLDDTLAVGDGANDLPMLQAAGLGVAYRAKPKVAAAADARIERTDLAALLYAQGFARKEFVEG
jgi:phosphoserine phosphatase